MSGKENPLELLVMCAVLGLFSLLGVIGGFSRGLFGNMDGILAIGICLMMGLISVLLLFSVAKSQGWLGKKSDPGNSGSSPAAAK
jgi:hypothetical protein